MDYEKAVKNYLALRGQCAAIEKKAKQDVAELKQKMSMLETWITLKADEEGLKSVPTTLGTGYWSTHYTCTVAEPAAFFDAVREQGAWDLLDKRANKTAVRAYIDANGAPPPGVNFGSYRAFNVRETKE
jgi:hypothetical protein